MDDTIRELKIIEIAEHYSWYCQQSMNYLHHMSTKSLSLFAMTAVTMPILTVNILRRA